MDTQIREIKDFIDSAHSVYHAVAGIVWELEAAGYICLSESAQWDLLPGGRYYLTRGGSSVIAFRIPNQEPTGFMISASHSDRPGYKVKENPELTGKYLRLAVEPYGGMIMSTWMDRPLSIAGRVFVETENGVESRLVDIDRDLMIMPNIAIHLNREINKGYTVNPAVDTVPLLGGADAAGKLEQLLLEQAGGRILGHDLYAYVRQNASVFGLEEEFIGAAGIDDLTCAWCATQGFLAAEDSSAIPVLCVFDSEEVGSISVQGAGSDFLNTVLQRIGSGLDVETERLLAQSFMVSADNGHALHPNHPELGDPNNAPVMNGGIVLKYNANMRYTTDGASAAIMRMVCEDANVPVQTYCNRADIPGGSTLGHVSLGHVSVLSADVGIAQLAMHSCYETAGVKDIHYLIKVMKTYYSTALLCDRDGSYSLS